MAAASPTCIPACTACMRCRRACGRCAASRRRRCRMRRFRCVMASAACSRRVGRSFSRTRSKFKRECLALSSPSPRSCGQRVGVRDSLHIGTRGESPSPGLHLTMQSDLSPQAGRGKEAAHAGEDSMTKSLQDKVIIVTGAGRGIGREIALLCAAEGAKVVVNDPGGAADGAGSSAAPAEEVVQEIKKRGGIAVPNFESVAEAIPASKIVKTATDHFGRLDGVVNNAGILRDMIFHKMS